MHLIDNQQIIELPAVIDYMPAWVAVILLSCFTLAGYLRIVYSSKLTNYMRAFFIRRYANQAMREEHSLSNPVSRNFTIIFFMSEALFLLTATTQHRIFSEYISFSFTSFLLIIGALFGILFFRLCLSWIAGILFAQTTDAGESAFSLFLENHMAGLMLLPVNVIVVYGEPYLQKPFLAAGIIIIFIAYLYRVGMGILAATQRPGIKWFYLFLYLCTLEILPLLIGYKVLRALA